MDKILEETFNQLCQNTPYVNLVWNTYSNGDYKNSYAYYDPFGKDKLIIYLNSEKLRKISSDNIFFIFAHEYCHFIYRECYGRRITVDIQEEIAVSALAYCIIKNMDVAKSVLYAYNKEKNRPDFNYCDLSIDTLNKIANNVDNMLSTEYFAILCTYNIEYKKRKARIISFN